MHAPAAAATRTPLREITNTQRATLCHVRDVVGPDAFTPAKARDFLRLEGVPPPSARTIRRIFQQQITRGHSHKAIGRGGQRKPAQNLTAAEQSLITTSQEADAALTLRQIQRILVNAGHRKRSLITIWKILKLNRFTTKVLHVEPLDKNDDESQIRRAAYVLWHENQGPVHHLGQLRRMLCRMLESD